jgi:hypothetical protein
MSIFFIKGLAECNIYNDVKRKADY